MKSQEGAAVWIRRKIFMPNAENVTKQSTMESGQAEQENLQDSESMDQSSGEALDPSYELYNGPDDIALIEERNSELESHIEELSFARDIITDSMILELNQKHPAKNISTIKAMVRVNPQIIDYEKKILKAKKTQRAVKVLLNKHNNRFISARKLFFQQ